MHENITLIKFPVRFVPRSALVLCDNDGEVLFLALCFLIFPPLPAPLLALDLHHRLVADALLGVANIDLLPLFL
jgi:hypothetical protein